MITKLIKEQKAQHGNRRQVKFSRKSELGKRSYLAFFEFFNVLVGKPGTNRRRRTGIFPIRLYTGKINEFGFDLINEISAGTLAFSCPMTNCIAIDSFFLVLEDSPLLIVDNPLIYN
jgi:hypothetical protein